MISPYSSLSLKFSFQNQLQYIISFISKNVVKVCRLFSIVVNNSLSLCILHRTSLFVTLSVQNIYIVILFQVVDFGLWLKRCYLDVYLGQIIMNSLLFVLIFNFLKFLSIISVCVSKIGYWHTVHSYFLFFKCFFNYGLNFRLNNRGNKIHPRRTLLLISISSVVMFCVVM